MLIIHENLPEEARALGIALRELYEIPSHIESCSLDGAFVPHSSGRGFFTSSPLLSETLGTVLQKPVLVITPRDLYAGDKSPDDDWVFGYCANNLMVASTARMKRQDNKPSDVLAVPRKLYLERMTALALHEVGHGVVQAPHHKPAYWVNVRTGQSLALGPHCTEPNCLMYESVDIRAPPREEGHLLLGGEKRHDAGLDDFLERRLPDWLCHLCMPFVDVN